MPGNFVMRGDRAGIALPAMQAGLATGPSSVVLIRHEFPGRLLEVRAALERVALVLEPLHLTTECAAAAEIVLAEVLNNVVEHAYATLRGTVDLELRLAGDTLACTVRDAGAQMPDGTPPLGRQVLVDVPLEHLPEGGFGWFLIRSLTRDLDYRRDQGRNRLTFLLPVDRREG